MQPDQPVPRTTDTPVHVLMVRKLTPVSVSINERDRTISLLITTHTGIVLLGLSTAGAELVVREVTRAYDELHRLEADRA